MQGDTLIWTKNDFDYEEGTFRIAISLDIPVPTNNVVSTCFWAKAEAFTGDIDPSNNEQFICQPILNSYDPNDIQVSPTGLCEEGYILNVQLLTYKIRFQNTGNADAINIAILDTLDEDLDIESFRLVSQSHEPMELELLSDRILSFSFDNIHLADSSSDEANSHGYVVYEIAPKDSLPAGREILNRAAIYFDFNEAVLTNSVRNTITDQLPGLDTTFLQLDQCDSFSLNGISYEESGLYYQSLSSGQNCDSTLALNLHIEEIEKGLEQIGGTLQALEEGAMYQWLDCDNGNAPIPNATNRSFSPRQNGRYAVQISKGSCVEVSDCVDMMRVNLDEFDWEQVKLFPNPTRDEVVLSFPYPQKELEIRMYNYAGILIKKLGFNDLEQLRFPLPKENGVYILELKTEQGLSMHKLLKQE